MTHEIILGVLLAAIIVTVGCALYLRERLQIMELSRNRHEAEEVAWRNRCLNAERELQQLKAQQEEEPESFFGDVLPSTDAVEALAEALGCFRCNCTYPKPAYKNGSGHAPTCPVQARWERRVRRQRTLQQDMREDVEKLHEILQQRAKDQSEEK